ncbi:LacI family DNA-binding transcriptional regulator [Nocardioides sp. CFH 31398]|uniref:LacI family DNA-binding transcriptional regulator n=1 Tax=Nocardioides sp. CFH 31398 TaxID=2919579 RepID=UPI001F05D8B5|nr:LacI family DNA-binding transcriptional regulator [Nocardioides sp. CFH 31398]MCH1864991.1 LacI family transcriptional regulator [Nocardioides sp. CFH 31398]
MVKRPTLQDVAAEAGVSPATASYALRGQRGSDATVERVRQAAERLGYDADPIARALATGSTGTVGVLCGSTRDLWQQRLAVDLSRALMARGRHAVVADADGDPGRERALLAKLREQRPDGLLVAPLDPDAAHWHDVAERFPVVCVGEQLPRAPSAGAVVFDNDAGMALVFDHLAGLGHRRVAVVLTARPSTPDRPAEDLVRRHAARVGVSVVLVHPPPATADVADLRDHLAAALAGPAAGVSVVFCLSDSLAFAALRAAAVRGLAVPDDLSVVGFEDLDVADLVGPGLTTMSWGEETVVDAAVGQLLVSIEDDVAPARSTIAPRLVVRGTTGPAR